MFRHFLEASDISKTIKGRTIIRKTSFEMRGGRVYGLKGDNGSGKTMLLRLLCGLSNISSGKVMVDGIDIVIDGSCRSQEFIVHVVRGLHTHDGSHQAVFSGKLVAILFRKDEPVGVVID